jgi:hypothetical protein
VFDSPSRASNELWGSLDGVSSIVGDVVGQHPSRCVRLAAANPAPKLATVVAGMCAGADCIDDVDVLRSGGMNTLFDGGIRTLYGRKIVAGVHLRPCPATGIGAPRTLGLLV